MYPLRFEPIFRRYLWGGRRLATELEKPIGEGICAESWELVDRQEENSVVAFGSYTGQTLHDLISTAGPELLGKRLSDRIKSADLPARLRGRFPLLLKFLDANKTLSVQVHPDDQAGLQKEIPDLGKTEAWYVMDAAPGSKIYCGLKSGVERADLAEAVNAGRTEEVIHAFEAKTGDCVFVPAGTVHAIGEGLLIAEIQQSSDTTYRLFDWNRVDGDGNARELHIDDALSVTNYQLGPVGPQTLPEVSENVSQALVDCDKFRIHCHRLPNETLQLPLHDECCLLMVVAGTVQVSDEPSGQPLGRGQTVLIPASMGAVTLSGGPEAEVLEIRIP